MKAKKVSRSKKNSNLTRIAVVVGAILLIPLFGNMFVSGWNWGLADFIIAGALLFGTGLAIDFAARKIKNPVYKVLVCLAILLTLALVWVELAVDGVSQLLDLFF